MDALDKFVRTYSFLSQIVSFGDSKLERDYIYCRALASRLRDESTVERLDLGTKVELSHLRSEVTFEGSLSLNADTGEVKAIFGEGRGTKQEPDIEPLSQIVGELNERFGMHLNDQDQLLLVQIEETWLADPDMRAQAQNNSFENFKLVFDQQFLPTVVRRMEENEGIVHRILNEEDLREVLRDFCALSVYQKARDS